MTWKLSYSVTYLAIALGAPVMMALVPLAAFHAERHAMIVQVSGRW